MEQKNKTDSFMKQETRTRNKLILVFIFLAITIMVAAFASYQDFNRQHRLIIADIKPLGTHAEAFPFWYMMVLVVSVIVSIGIIIWYVYRRKHLIFYRGQYNLMELLKESETRYRRLFEAAKDGVLLIDFNTGVILDVNPFLIELLGYPKSEFLKKKLWDVGVFKNAAISKDRFSELQNQEFVRHECLPFQTKEGKKIFVECVSNTYLVGDKKRIQCNIRDITERKEAQDALERAAQDWQITFDAASDMIMQLDRQMNIVKANRAVSEILGLPINEIIGKKCHKLIHGSDSPFPACPVERSIRTKSNESGELFFPNLGIWALVKADPIWGKDMEVEGVVHTVHDIT